jgi:hypothetical protein
MWRRNRLDPLLPTSSSASVLQESKKDGRMRNRDEEIQQGGWTVGEREKGNEPFEEVRNEPTGEEVVVWVRYLWVSGAVSHDVHSPTSFQFLAHLFWPILPKQYR